MADIKNIIVHCSDSAWGDEFVINKWHKERKFKTVNVGGVEMSIGYNAVILNGFLRNSRDYIRSFDGALASGRYVDLDMDIEADEKMAHALGHNSTTIGICIIGKDKFTRMQIIRARLYITERMRIHGLNPEDVLGHYEVNDGKTCPNIDMDVFRRYLVDRNIRRLSGVIWKPRR